MHLTVLLVAMAQSGFPWPIGPGDETPTIMTKFGQLEQHGACLSNSDFHQGLDIAGAPGSPVFATEAGKVKLVVADDEIYSRIAIESDGDPGFGLAYVHLDPATIAVAPGDLVATNDYLGDVAKWTKDPDYHHLHLAWVAGDSSALDARTWGGYFSIGNPLPWLAPLDDADKPEIHTIDGEPFLFRENGTEVKYHPLCVPASGEVPLDVIARVSDVTGANSHWPTTPYSAMLRIAAEDGTAEQWHLLFDGLLEDKSVLSAMYACGAPADSLGEHNPTERAFYLVLTNGGPTNEYYASGPNAWLAKPGTYHLELTVTHAAGNSRTKAVTETVLAHDENCPH